jgi:hypothetical protein
LIIKEKQKGHRELSDDDIKQFRILNCLIKKYEENNEKVEISTRDEHLSSHRVRRIIDELSLNQIIAKPLMGQGEYYFEILDKIRFRNYIYNLIGRILNKIPQDTFQQRFKKIDWHDPYLVKILGSLAVILIVAFGAFIWNSIQGSTEDELQPRVEIDSVSFFPTTFSCGQYSSFDLSYKVAHIGGAEVGFGQPFYTFINQTFNTCLENFTFFNNTPPNQALCYNKFTRGDKLIEACNPKFDPIFKETISVESNLNNLTRRMLNQFKAKNISDCKISEQVIICVELDEKGYCSEINTIDINYIRCKN